MAINTGNWGKSLWPGINAWFGDEYGKYNTQWTELFDSYSSRLAREEDVGTSYFGLAKVKNEGAPVEYDTAQQGFINRYENVTYALGFILTYELFEDERYDVIAPKRARSLAFSMNQTKEIVAANVYNRAFNSNFPYGDGKELLATDHPNVKGGTFSNELNPAADLSEQSIEDLCIQIQQAKNDAGLRIAIQPQKLIVPPDLQFDAERILMSPLQNDTANNAVNAVRGKMPIVVNQYLTDSKAWFVKTDVPDGMKHFERVKLQFTQDNDFDSDNLKYKARERYSFGASDPRGLYGSAGA